MYHAGRVIRLRCVDRGAKFPGDCMSLTSFNYLHEVYKMKSSVHAYNYSALGYSSSFTEMYVCTHVCL